MGVRRPGGRDLTEFGLGALWALPVLVATAPVALALTQLLPVTPVSPLPPAGESVGFALNLLAAAIIAPVGEELLFRGFATTAWVRGMGERRAIVRGALFFAVVHVLTISGSSAGEALGLALVAFAHARPGRPGARLAVRQARHDLGAARAARGLQRHARRRRRGRRAQRGHAPGLGLTAPPRHTSGTRV